MLCMLRREVLLEGCFLPCVPPQAWEALVSFVCFMKFASNSNLLQVPPKFASVYYCRPGAAGWQRPVPLHRPPAASGCQAAQALGRAVLAAGHPLPRCVLGALGSWPNCGLVAGHARLPSKQGWLHRGIVGHSVRCVLQPTQAFWPRSADNIMKLVAMRMDTCETCEEEVRAFILRAGPRCCMRVGGGLACILFAGWTVLAARGTSTGWVGDSGLTATSPKPTFHLHPTAPLTHPTPPHPTTHPHPHSLTPNPACPS